MPFKKGKKPALTVPMSKIENLVMALLKAGYDEHSGRKVKLRSEVATMRKRFVADKKRRQCHVQFICEDGKQVRVFAHTEPDMATVLDLFTHGYAAIMDHANFQAGARMLKRDLARVGFRG